MAIVAELHLQRLEETIAELRLALQQPRLINMRVLSTDATGVACIEVLQEDLPFESPTFQKTSVFDHPNIRSVEFRTWPVPHYFIVGTVEGVLSAMRSRFAYFVQLHATRFFKEVSADSLISRPNAHLLPAIRASLMQHPLRTSLSLLPPLEPIPPAMLSASSSSQGSCWGPSVYSDYDIEDWDSEPEVVDPIPPINFRPYDPAIDGHLYTPPTPPPITDFQHSTTLTPIKETVEIPTQPMEDSTLTTPIDPETVSIQQTTPANPPTVPQTPEVSLQPDTPTDLPSNPKQMGLETFQKIKQKFHFLFK
jgi:hypothetical protein